MSSSESVLRWERQWAHMLTRTRSNAAASASRLRLAETNVQRAKREAEAGDHDAALIFAEQALINAADALLSRDGYSATSHMARFSYPQLPGVYADERHLIDRIRSARNAAQYEAAGSVPQALAAAATKLAARAIEEMRRLIA